MSAKKLLKALQDENIVGSKGSTTFTLAGVTTVVNDNSVVGNLIQEWLAAFMRKHGIEFRSASNTQKFPDFLLAENQKTDLLEVKCFTKSPNFDVANLAAYCRSLLTEAYRLDADYLIFKYKPNSNGIEITDIWLRKVWQITGASEKASVKVQWKQKQPYNIRPATWDSRRAQYPAFESRLDFIKALHSLQNTQTFADKNWLKEVAKNYKYHTGKEL